MLWNWFVTFVLGQRRIGSSNRHNAARIDVEKLGRTWKRCKGMQWQNWKESIADLRTIGRDEAHVDSRKVYECGLENKFVVTLKNKRELLPKCNKTN